MFSREAKMKLTLGAALLFALVMPTAAAADGLPLPVEDLGGSGIATADGEYRFVTVAAGPDTVVERIEQDGGAVSDWTRLEGEYTIPAVALDGSPGGLSADGETLVLIRPRPGFPRRTTEFVRFDTDDLSSAHPFRLEGDFSFDALSPDGRTMYLINYVEPRDPTEYFVRAFDLERGELLPGKILDPDEEGEEMYGYAVSRETSPDGRWAYTLYWGREHPFIHALDTVDGTAACIDLDSLAGSLGLDQTSDGSGLLVTRKGVPVLVVDTETHAVAQAPAKEVADAAARGARADSADAGGGPAEGWLGATAIVLGVAMLALGGMLATRRRRRAIA